MTTNNAHPENERKKEKKGDFQGGMSFEHVPVEPARALKYTDKIASLKRAQPRSFSSHVTMKHSNKK